MESVRRLYLLRHGETAWNRDGNRYLGRTDVPLAESGRTQAGDAAHLLANVAFTHAYCSPLSRSRETAEIVLAGRALPLRVDPRLFEVDFGAWEGLTQAEIETIDADMWEARQRDPANVRAGGTGETGGEVCARMVTLVNDVLRPGTVVLMVGHNTLNRMFIAATLGMPLHAYRRLVQANGGISVLERTAAGDRWMAINLTAFPLS